MKSTKFFIRMLAVFFERVNPASHNANPGCIQKTNMAANSIHTVSSDNPISFIIVVFLKITSYPLTPCHHDRQCESTMCR